MGIQSLMLLFCFLGFLFLFSTAITPSKLFISITIDASNEEVIREGIRLLQSIRVFGGSMNNATIEVAIAHPGSCYCSC